MDMDGRARNRTAPPDHVDLEDLAALVDGRLPAADCSRVRAHLAECEECYEIFADVVRFQEAEVEVEVEAASRVAAMRMPPSPFDKAKKAIPWLAAAAAAVLVMAGLGTWLTYFRAVPPSASVAEIASPLAGEVKDEDFLDEYRPRGGNEQVTAWFALGVQMVDLHIALAQRSPEVDDIRQVVGTLALQIEFLDRDQVNHALLQIERRENVQAAMQELEKAFSMEGEAEQDYLFGVWAEAARIAAVTEQEDFFDDRENRRAFSWFARQKNLPTQTREDLVQIRKLWNQRDLTKLANVLNKMILRDYEASIRGI